MIKRLLSIVTIICILVLGAMTFVPSHHMTHAAQATARPLPACPDGVLTMSLSPTPQDVKLQQPFSVTLQWNCGQWIPLSFAVYWDDWNSNIDTYDCHFNCISGSQVFTHTYTSTDHINPNNNPNTFHISGGSNIDSQHAADAFVHIIA